MGEQTQEENHPLENLMRFGFVMFGLVVLVAVVVACLPSGTSFGHGWRQAFTSMTASLRTSIKGSIESLAHKQIASATQTYATPHMSGRYVSYNDPQVRSTLNIPWARN